MAVFAVVFVNFCGGLLDTWHWDIEQLECLVLKRRWLGGEHDGGIGCLWRGDQVEGQGSEVADQTAKAGERQAIVTPPPGAFALGSIGDVGGSHR